MGFKKLFRSQEFWVSIIFIIVLSIRIIIAFQTPLLNYESYYTLRQIENIKNTGLPLYNDPLSYGGKTQLYNPLYYYMLAVFSFFIPENIVVKILPNIFASLIIILVYFIGLKITKHPKISFLGSLMSGFIPILYFDINRASQDYLSMILIFAIIYCIMRINEKKYIDYSLILAFLLVLTSPLAFIVIFGLLIYMLLMRLENENVEIKEIELILFFSFLTIWIHLLLFKNALLKHGIMVIWQNMPAKIISGFFSKLTIIETIYTISIIPLILGIYGAYKTFHNTKNKEVMILIGFTIGVFLLMWFRLLNIIISITLLSISLVLMTVFAIKNINDFIEKTKIYRYKKIFLLIFIILFFITSVIPSMYIGIKNSKDTPNVSDILVLEWASKNIPKTATIAGTLEEGHIIAHYANRKNIMDDNFLLTENIDSRLNDLDTIYTTKFQIEAISKLENYKSKYIILTDYARKKYNIQNISYINNECFQEIFYSQNTSIYYVKCKIRD